METQLEVKIYDMYISCSEINYIVQELESILQLKVICHFNI